MRLWLVTLLAVLVAAPAYADISKCWWVADDPSHPELTCAPLTLGLLTSLEGASRAQVVKVMGASGVPDDGGVLSFESNYAFRRQGYSGAVAFTLNRDGRVVVINAAVDAPHHRRGMKFVWNAAVPGCSDFPGSIQRCDNTEGAPRPPQDAQPSVGAPTRDWLPKWLRWPFFHDR
jgi:hypothetical protein